MSPLSDLLVQRLEEHSISDAAQETFVTVRLYGRGALRRDVAEGKTPAMRSVYRLVAGDLLYSRIDARNGAFAIVPPELAGAVVSKDFPCFAVRRNRVNPMFLIGYLGSSVFYEQLRAASFGTTNRQRISEQALLGYEIPLPPLAEQDRILRLLDEAQGLRRLRDQADERTRAIVPALFAEFFGDPVGNERRWPMVAISDLVERFEAGRSVAPAGDDNTSSKYRVLKVSAVTRGRFAADESKPVPDSCLPRPEHFVRPGDMLFSRANTTELVGATVLVEECPNNLLLPDKLWRFVWKVPPKIEPRFALAVFQHPSIRSELGRRSTGTGGSMKNIAMGKVLTMQVPLPPLSLQRVFAARVAESRGLEAAQGASGQRLDELFESLLHRAFQGDL